MAGPSIRRVAVAAACSLGAGAAALAASTGATIATGPSPPQPNIVVVVTDDQSLGDFSERVMPSTHELVVDQGTRFPNATVTTPLCCPSRASYFSGQYGHNNGVLRNRYVDLQGKANLLPVWLRDAGYRTAHVGKFLNGYTLVEGKRRVLPGWDRWQTVLGEVSTFRYLMNVDGDVVRYGNDPRDHLSTVTTRRARKLAAGLVARPSPFYLHVDYFAPHDDDNSPKRCGGGPWPTRADNDLFRHEPLPKSPNFNEADVSDKPTTVSRLPSMGQKVIDRLRGVHRCRLASLRAVDRGLRKIYEAVEAAGELDRTVFLFMSDNGFQMGAHRLLDTKYHPYGESVRVPLAMRVPDDYLGGSPQAEVSELVANIDLTPTLLELAGASAGRTLDGRSLVPLMSGDASGWPADRGLGVELSDDDRAAGETAACEYHGVRTASALYVHHVRAAPELGGPCLATDQHEVYDLGTDPFELDNLLATDPPAGTALKAQLAPRAAALEDCAGIQGRDPLPPSGHWCE